jgi:molybdopterin-guanine dinucleotide biosynthesis protein A
VLQRKIFREGVGTLPDNGAAAAVLAGGLSSRMGTSKAWLEFDGLPLLTRVVQRLREIFSEIVVVGATEQSLPDPGVPVVRDRVAQRGPLGGLEVALASVAAPAVFAVSCDTPFLQPALARRMVDLAHGFEAAVPRWEGRLNPLLAVYGTGLLPRVSRLLAEGRLRPAYLLEESRTRIVEEAEIRPADPAGLSFVNMNHPAEYRTALASAPPRVTVELFGQPAILAGAREVSVDVLPPPVIGSALRSLARSIPPLVGPVLTPDGRPGPGFMLSVEGREFTLDLDRPVTHGDRIFLLAATAGG